MREFGSGIKVQSPKGTVQDLTTAQGKFQTSSRVNEKLTFTTLGQSSGSSEPVKRKEIGKRNKIDVDSKQIIRNWLQNFDLFAL